MTRSLLTLAVALLGAGELSAQPQFASRPAGGTPDTTAAAAPRSESNLAPAVEIQHIRVNDKRGIATFESPKEAGVPFGGFRLNFGAAFTQQFQGLGHENEADPRMVAGVDANQLMVIGHGFNNASANLYVNAQLAPGIRVALTSYLSSRHHNETWVKDGYLLVDELPFRNPLLDRVMKYVTVRAGHFEVNYGDAHFRRSDNGNAMFNPFIGNLVMDAFTTEVGAEVYVRKDGLMMMVGATGGEIKGNILTPADRAPAYLAKLGVDRKLSPELRVRVTGSVYANRKSPGGTLFAGDRAGSRYFFVLENTTATSTAQASSGLINPQFRREVTAVQLNPFIKYRGLEFFGVLEQAKGANSATEVGRRTWDQQAAELVYRFLGDDKAYVAARYNAARGELVGMPSDVSAERSQFGAGWFLTPNVLLKGEWVRQVYLGFPVTDIRSGGGFKGFMVEGVVSF